MREKIVRRITPKLLTLGLFLAVVQNGATSLVHAHSGAKGVVKERMDMMKGMGDAMKAMGAMFKGEAPFEPGVLAEQAALLAKHAKQIPTVTPKGSDDHPSEALPIIWLEWEDYVLSADELVKGSENLVNAAKSGASLAETRAQFVDVSKTCGRCHDRFRKPKEK